MIDYLFLPISYTLKMGLGLSAAYSQSESKTFAAEAKVIWGGLKSGVFVQVAACAFISSLQASIF